METFESFKIQLYSVNANNFDDIALKLFRHQAAHNPLYREFLSYLNVNPAEVGGIYQIPFLPIRFFKQHTVKTGAWSSDIVFTSSGTTGQLTSSHHVFNKDFYLSHAERCFSSAFGPIEQYHLLALLPSYLERSGSSLVAMIDHFIKKSGSPYSGFYLNNVNQLLSDLERLRSDGKQVILWGVTFALLDIALRFKPDLSHCMVFETGGMKGRGKEITRTELHEILCSCFNISKIYSEYGMTELLSQAYSQGEGTFQATQWMKIVGRDITDPFRKGLLHETAGINVIDLANWHSIAFIETEDLGKIYSETTFEIMGRMDNSDVRGCNLLA